MDYEGMSIEALEQENNRLRDQRNAIRDEQLKLREVLNAKLRKQNLLARLEGLSEEELADLGITPAALEHVKTQVVQVEKAEGVAEGKYRG